MRRRPILLLLAAVTVAACGGTDTGNASASAERGEELFVANCAVCHGEAAMGTATGPPLIHEIYEPGHHPDEAFHRAVAEGTPAHHWEFGDMPPVTGLERDDVDDIIAWVREQQRAAGIE